MQTPLPGFDAAPQRFEAPQQDQAPRLDPERRRRRLRLLAEYADATAQRMRMSPERDRIERIRGIVDARKRLAG
jgi:hypothetical protein